MHIDCDPHQSYSWFMHATGTIFDIKRYSINDGPGIRTTVFFQGCPLACQWCHNPESRPRNPVLMVRQNRCVRCGDCIPACPESCITLDGTIHTDRIKCKACGRCVKACVRGARELSGYATTVDKVMAVIERDIPFFDQSHGGVTFSGGEPLMQPEFLRALLLKCRESGLHTVVDTSGFAPWPVLESMCDLVDLFLYDLKLLDEQRHIQYTGVSNRTILQNLKYLLEKGQTVLLRMPLVPEINDDEENLRQTGEFVAALPGKPMLELMPYHDLAAAKFESLGIAYPLSNIKPPAGDEVQKSKYILEKYGATVKTG